MRSVLDSHITGLDDEAAMDLLAHQIDVSHVKDRDEPLNDLPNFTTPNQLITSLRERTEIGRAFLESRRHIERVIQALGMNGVPASRKPQT